MSVISAKISSYYKASDVHIRLSSHLIDLGNLRELKIGTKMKKTMISERVPIPQISELGFRNLTLIIFSSCYRLLSRL
jgi:hypothetical protein